MTSLSVDTRVSRVLYVRHLPTLADERKLKRLFSRYGDVLNVEVIPNPEWGRSSSLGVVTMGDEAGADAAIAALHRSPFFGGALSVRRATSD